LDVELVCFLTMPVDWTPYREEVLAFYIGQDKTADETLAFLKEKYDLRVT
jgi:hypothetical protein